MDNDDYRFFSGNLKRKHLVYLDKKIAGVKPKSIAKQMKTKHFAKAVSRERL